MNTRNTKKCVVENSAQICATAFTMPELLAIIAVIALAGYLALSLCYTGPRYNAREKALRIRCASNLKQIGVACRIWESDHNDSFPMQFYTNQTGGLLYADSSNAFRCFQVMSNELNNPNILICPDDKKHRPASNFNTDFNATRLSYFVSLDANDTQPQMFLAGDSHLTNGTAITNGILQLSTSRSTGWTMERHGGTGNVALADGSVQQFTTSALRSALQNSGLATNRLLLPP